MDRKDFFERIVPGLRELREASLLEQALGKDLPEDIAQKINKLKRLGRLKALAAAALAVGGTAVWKWSNREQITSRLQRKSAINMKMDELFKGASLESLTSELLMESDGHLVNSTRKPTNRIRRSSGMNFGFSSNIHTITVPETGEQIKFTIDRKNSTMQAMDENNEKIGEPVSLEQNINVDISYLDKNKVKAFRFKIEIDYENDGQPYHHTYNLHFKFTSPSGEEEERIYDDIKTQLRLVDPRRLPLEAGREVLGVVDKNGQVIDLDTIPMGELLIEMGEGTVFLGDPQVSIGTSGKYNFRVASEIYLDLLDSTGANIAQHNFTRNILFSRSHLRERGVDKIVLIVPVVLELEMGEALRKIFFEYGIDDFARLEGPLPLKLSNGNKVTLVP